MKTIGRVILEAGDRSEYYPLTWDQTLSIALLPGGACTVRQGGNAYAFQGVTTPVAYTDAPGVTAASLDALTAAVHALPAPPDNSATLAAIQVAITALMSKLPPDATPALTAMAAAVTKLLTAAASGPTTIALPNGSAGGVWTPFNAADPDPTITIGTKPAVVTPLSTTGTAFAP
jgi:hypothetical protein